MEFQIPTNVAGTPYQQSYLLPDKSRTLHPKSCTRSPYAALSRFPIPILVNFPGGDDQPKKPEITDPYLGVQTPILSFALSFVEWGFGFSPSLSLGPAIGTGLMYHCRCL